MGLANRAPLISASACRVRAKLPVAQCISMGSTSRRCAATMTSLRLSFRRSSTITSTRNTRAARPLLPAQELLEWKIDENHTRRCLARRGTCASPPNRSRNRNVFAPARFDFDLRREIERARYQQDRADVAGCASCRPRRRRGHAAPRRQARSLQRRGRCPCRGARPQPAVFPCASRHRALTSTCRDSAARRCGARIGPYFADDLTPAALFDPREDGFGPRDHGPVDHFSVNRNGGTVNRFGGFHDAFGPTLLLGGGLETLVHHIDLPRMYAQFRAEAEAPGAQRIAADAFRIVNGCGDSIDWRREGCNARNQDELGAKIQEVLLLPLNSQIKLKVDGAKHEPMHFRVRK